MEEELSFTGRSKKYTKEEKAVGILAFVFIFIVAACFFAMLGGVERFFGPTELFGTSDVSSESTTLIENND